MGTVVRHIFLRTEKAEDSNWSRVDLESPLGDHPEGWREPTQGEGAGYPPEARVRGDGCASCQKDGR